MVLFRLLCPYSISLNTSLFNILPPASVNNGQIEYDIPELIHPEITEQPISDKDITAPFVDTVVSQQLQEDIVTDNYISAPDKNVIVAEEKSSVDFIEIISVLWLFGGMYIMLNNLISIFEIKNILNSSTHLKDNIYLNNIIPTAFISGVLRPRIYLPDNLDDEQQKYILLHEQTHIRRKDYIFKLLGFVAVCLHWFNPLVWVAFNLAENDMEMSCDEAVIRQLGNNEKRGYSQTLLSISIPKNNQFAMHLAFGEGETKNRILNVLNFKTPAVKYVVGILVIISFALIVLISNPYNNNIVKLTGISNETITHSVLRKENIYNIVDENEYPNIIKDLKKISLSSADDVQLKDDIGYSYIILSDDVENKFINFNENFTKMWVLNTGSDIDCKIFNVRNPEKAELIFNRHLNSTETLKEITQIILPSFRNSTYCEGSAYDLKDKYNPAQINVQLPENWYVTTSRYVLHMRVGYAEDSVSIFDHTNSHVGTISYRKLNGESSIEDFISIHAPTLVEYMDKMVIHQNGSTEIMYLPTDEIASKCLIAVNAQSGHAISIDINCNKISDRQFEDIVTSIELKNPDIEMQPMIDYSYEFKVEKDETLSSVGRTAIEHIMSELGIKYRITDLYIHKPDYPADYSYTVNFKYEDENYVEKPTWFVIYLNKIDDVTYKIIGYPAFNYYSLYPIYESYTTRVQRVAELPYSNVTQKDSSMNLGEVKVISQGQNGLASQTVDIEYVNGIVVRENIIENNILKETIDNVVAYGSSYDGEEVLTGSGRLIWPTAAGRIARGFTGQYPSHNGIDISAPTGTAIYASDTGVVTSALYTNVGYGIYCIIEHGTYQTLYAHCSELAVSVGQTVKQGQLIGYVGSTGNSTGPHLHFEVKNGDERYDPYSWF